MPGYSPRHFSPEVEFVDPEFDEGVEESVRAEIYACGSIYRGVDVLPHFINYERHHSPRTWEQELTSLRRRQSPPPPPDPICHVIKPLPILGFDGQAIQFSNFRDLIFNGCLGRPVRVMVIPEMLQIATAPVVYRN